jgi:hypothetical protein
MKCGTKIDYNMPDVLMTRYGVLIANWIYWMLISFNYCRILMTRHEVWIVIEFGSYNYK